MRGLAMVLFLSTTTALPISKPSSGTGEIMTSFWSPQVLEHRASDPIKTPRMVVHRASHVIETPQNSCLVNGVAKRVAEAILPQDVMCYLTKEACLYHSSPEESADVSAATATAEDTKDTLPDASMERRDPARFWGASLVETTEHASDTEKATATASSTPHIKGRSPQGPTFWGSPHVDDTPSHAGDNAANLENGDAYSEDRQKNAWPARGLDE